MGIMAILQIVFFALGNVPKILGAITAVEDVVEGRGKGEEKKKQVVDGINAVVDSAYTAGLPVDVAGRELIRDGLTGLVDPYVSYYNQSGKFSKGPTGK
jgi:hypothetical protein